MNDQQWPPYQGNQDPRQGMHVQGNVQPQGNQQWRPERYNPDAHTRRADWERQLPAPRRQVQPYRGQWPPPPQQPYPPQQWQPAPARPPANAAAVIILSFLIPGLGSIIGGSYVHGAIILAAFLLSALLILVGIGLLLVPVTWLWGMIAACILVSRR